MNLTMNRNEKCFLKLLSLCLIVIAFLSFPQKLNSTNVGQSIQNETSNSEELDLDAKDILEIKKLELEIKAMNKPVWQNPAIILAIFSSLIALIGLFLGFYTGFFDNQKILLETKKEKVASEVNKLEDERKRLYDEVNLKTQAFLDDNISSMEEQVYIFFLKDLKEVLYGNMWLYQEDTLSTIIFPEYFTSVSVPRTFLEEINQHLNLLAWEPSFGFPEVEEAPLKTAPKEDGYFHSWVSLRSLLTGDPKWLKAHAMECTYDREKADIAYKDLLTLRNKHKSFIIEKYVRKFPPLKNRIEELMKKYRSKNI